MLVHHSASYNIVIDYVPLLEISLVDYELQAKDTGKNGSVTKNVSPAEPRMCRAVSDFRLKSLDSEDD